MLLFFSLCVYPIYLNLPTIPAAAQNTHHHCHCHTTRSTNSHKIFEHAYRHISAHYNAHLDSLHSISFVFSLDFSFVFVNAGIKYTLLLFCPTATVINAISKRPHCRNLVSRGFSTTPRPRSTFSDYQTNDFCKNSRSIPKNYKASTMYA